MCTSSLTSWPFAIRNFGIRSTFQSLATNKYFDIEKQIRRVKEIQWHLPAPAVALVGRRHPELGEELLQGGQGGGLAAVVLVPGGDK